MKLTKRQKRYAMIGGGTLGVAAAVGGGYGVRQLILRRRAAAAEVAKGVKKVNDLISRIDRTAMTEIKKLRLKKVKLKQFRAKQLKINLANRKLSPPHQFQHPKKRKGPLTPL